MSSEFGESGSSVKALQWLAQYKRLSVKPRNSLTDGEQKLLHDLESKLGALLEKRRSDESLSEADVSKRRCLRVNLTMKAIFKSAGDLNKAYIKNLSGGGLFVASDKMTPIGTRVKLEILLPSEVEPIEVTCEVAWLNPRRLGGTEPGMGFKFVELDEKVRSKIQRHLNEAIEAGLKEERKKKAEAAKSGKEGI